MKGLLSKIEVLVIGLFVLLFLIWAVSKCNSSKEKLREEAATEAKEDSLARVAKPSAAAPAPSPAAQPAAGGTTPPASPPPATQETSPPVASQPSQTSTQEPPLSRLYVTIDKLKLRKTPGLKGELLGELALFDEVFYMNEVTDSTFEVNLGKETANEPYVKVKTKKGTVGWVYGAGVHYVKKKRSGVLE